VTIAGVLNLVGAFLSVEVAKTISSATVRWSVAGQMAVA
jgi:hypothetical protein